LQRQLPNGFIESLRGIKEFNEEAFVRTQTGSAPPVSIRLNPFKEWEGKSLFLYDGRVPWCSNGLYLSGRPSFTADPLFHGGAYYVQEASSMFLHHVLMQLGADSPGKIIVDLCAAPGGKSTLIQSVIHSSSMLISNEVIKTRVNILQENMQKWGAGNSIITQNDPAHFGQAGSFCEFLVVDAPCSGSGLFRKDEEALEHWSESQVAHCSLRQKRILEQSLPALKEDGFLIYATCSFSTAENEDIVSWLMDKGMEPVRIITDTGWNIVETLPGKGYGYRFFPDKLRGEGFFLSAFQKNGTSAGLAASGRKRIERVPAKMSTLLKSFITNPDEYTLFTHEEMLVSFPDHYVGFLEWAINRFYVKQAGTPIGEMVRNELVPHHALALSQCVHPLAEKINIPTEDALQYLRRADFHLDAKPGWKILTCNNLPLGWVKVLPNRINNYYPKHWRILNR